MCQISQACVLGLQVAMYSSWLVVCEWYLDQLQHSVPCQKALHSSAGLRQELFWPNFPQMQWNVWSQGHA